MRLILVIGLFLIAAFALAIGGHAAIGELQADFRRRPVRMRKPSEGGLARAHDVEFPAGAAQIHAWYVPPRNGALVVLVHGTGGNRAQLSHEAEALIGAGYGVLPMDFPGNGESTGRPRWNEGERQALRGALDFAVHEGVDPKRIGVFAFSMGTMIAIQVAAGEPRISALVLAGPFDDPDRPIAHAFRKWGPLSQWPAIWAAHLAGLHVDGRRPTDLVATMTCRHPAPGG